MDAFAAYARDRGIRINEAIRPHRFPGRGLGIAATRTIQTGAILMQVPLSALLMPCSTTSAGRADVPRGEDTTARAHATLAVQVAFGDMHGHDAWRATWPSLLDFQTGLPLLWPPPTRELYCRSCARQSAVTAATAPQGSQPCGHVGDAFAVLPPPLTGRWATVPSPATTAGSEMKATTRETDGKPLLPSQSAKFNLDLAAAARLRPELDFSAAGIRDRFTWAWCIVNTRCFYYVAPGATPPADSDEAMVLCPGIDLFNHSSHGCSVTYDNEGFWVRAERDYGAGEEIVTSYGAHGEDTLMGEYGFMMGGETNSWDGVGIDGAVLATLAAEETTLLADYGFLGGYTMRGDGVCWRTEVAARCVVMEVAKWDRFVAGRWTDYEDEVDRRQRAKKQRQRRRNGAVDGGGKESPKQMASRQMEHWVEQVKKEAENSLTGLQAMKTSEISRLFGACGGSNNVHSPGSGHAEMAHARYDMVLRRWKQIFDTSCKALASLKSDR